ncbi:MAG TPA: hypothetical protein VL092_00895, partial [Chitinophagaceae bacterium]|nr:hypothetical protein [Chitinophagaceae bacterium]
SQLADFPAAVAELSTVFTAKAAPSAKLAAIKGATVPTAAWKRVFIKALQDSSYEVVQASLEKLCKTYPEESERFLQETKEVYGMSNSVSIKWHELAALYTAGKKVSQDRLVDYASAKWEFRTRGNAFSALKNLGYCDEQLIAHIFDALLSTNSRLVAPAAQLAEFLAQQTAYKNMMAAYYKSRTWAAWEKTQLKSSLAFL